MTPPTVAQHIDLFRERFSKITQEVGRRIVGHTDIVEATVTSLLAGGHVLLEGIPGVGKTSLVHTLANVLHLKFSRIQFTPDLMPADIVGTNIVQEHAHGGMFFEFQPGPIFANVVLADEINRATPKTQSALLEAMQEISVTVGKTTYQLEQPFLVLATQNPLEMEGTYPLPEAQLDRFFFKLKVVYPAESAMHEIIERTTKQIEVEVSRVMDGREILEMRDVSRSVPDARESSGVAVRDAAREEVRALWREPACGSSVGARRQDSRTDARSAVRLGRGHPRLRAPGAAAPAAAQLRGRGGADQC
jgi:MoxR-like ATPase